MVVGVQFTRGRWLQLLVGAHWGTGDRRKQNGLLEAPGLIGLGISMFFLGFFTGHSWASIGNAVFVLAIVYLVGTNIVVYINFGREK